jgi:hypothetical protein
MQSDYRALVVTSLNPFAKLDYQMLCFERWKSTGMQVITCNTRSEANRLIKAGFLSSDIQIVRDDRSGLKLFGKPVPLIYPLLLSLSKEHEHDCFVLTNSDIYPAIRSSSIVRYWMAQAPALALTREETHDLSAHSYDRESPYRGGLDTFILRRSALEKVNYILGERKATPRMAFGVPGWDYLMGSCILSSEVGGKILDSQVLLHESHQTTYGNMSEFKNYVPDLQRMGMVKGTDPAIAADEFASLIDQGCRSERKASRMARLLYYKAPERTRSVAGNSAEFEICWQRLMTLAPIFKGRYRKRAVASLFNRMASDSSASMDTALSFLVDSKSAFFQFNQALFAIVFVLMARHSNDQPAFTRVYPKANQHAAALRNILNRHDENDPLRRFWIARLFGSELIDHKILNPRIYQYLLLASENDCELALILEIRAFERSKQSDTS